MKRNKISSPLTAVMYRKNKKKKESPKNIMEMATTLSVLSQAESVYDLFCFSLTVKRDAGGSSDADEYLENCNPKKLNCFHLSC